MTTPAPHRSENPRLPALQRVRHWQLTRGLDSVPVSEVAVERDLRVRMSDGTVLLTDHWVPRTPTPGAPVLLTRTPYGREGFAAEALTFAERGHHVVVQSCRGHFGSEGTFNPFFDEAADGLDCVAWIEAQPWFTGSHPHLRRQLRRHDPVGPDPAPAGLGRGHGHRRLGPVVPALDPAPPGRVRPRDRRRLARRPGLDGGLGAAPAAHPCSPRAGPSARRSDALPPTRAVERATGSDTAFFQDWLARGPDDPWWEPIDFVRAPSQVPPLVLVAGFYDLFGHAQVEDFVALRAAGRPVRLVAGPWSHVSPEISAVALAESLRQLAGVEAVQAEPAVRIRPIGSRRG